ncbi:MAG: cold-shock protein [Pseudomonadota bacterium]|nr:cold-shock protein [Pseudomonadota bacterium]
MRVNGTVKFFNHSRGFGFIAPENGEKDVFVHITALERSGLPALDEGQKVTFEIQDDPRGRGKQAANIQLAS